jgi:hypothetical protein
MLFERKISEFNAENSKRKKFIKNLQTSLSKKGKTFDKWKSVYKGLLTKQKIIKLENGLHWTKDTFPSYEDLESFWNQVLEDLNFFENVQFTRKMNNYCESLLHLFFYSLKCSKKRYNSLKMIQIFQRIIDKTNLKMDQISNRYRTPFHDLILLDDLEFFEYVIFNCKINQYFPFLNVMSMTQTNPKMFSLLIQKFGMLELREYKFLQIFQNSNLETFNILTQDFKHPEYLKKIDMSSWIRIAKRNYKDAIVRLNFCFEHTSTKESKGLTLEQLKNLFTFGFDRLLIIPLIMKFKDQLPGLPENFFKFCVKNLREMKCFVDHGFDISKSSKPYLFYILMFWGVFFLENRIPDIYDCIDFLLDHGYDINTKFEKDFKFVSSEWPSEAVESFGELKNYLEKKGFQSFDKFEIPNDSL